MKRVITSDRSSWDRGLAEMAPDRAEYVQALHELIGAVNDRVRLIVRGAPPAEMIKALEFAKAGLAHLETHHGARGIDFPNLDSFRRRVEQLEATFRAFGFYRMAGVN